MRQFYELVAKAFYTECDSISLLDAEGWAEKYREASSLNPKTPDDWVSALKRLRNRKSLVRVSP